MVLLDLSSPKKIGNGARGVHPATFYKGDSYQAVTMPRPMHAFLLFKVARRSVNTLLRIAIKKHHF